MASNITLSAGVRQNLLSLQNTANLMATTQNRLATGKKVNTALDNPTNFFTSASLQARAGDMNSLLDSMSNGIKTLEAADNGLSSITKTVESMQSTLRQARQDKSFKTASYTVDETAIEASSIDTNAEAKQIQFSGGSVGTTAVKVDLSTANGTLLGGTYKGAGVNFAEAADKLTFKLALNGSSTTTAVTVEQGTDANSLKITVGSTVTDNIGVTDRTAVTLDRFVSAINTAFDAASLGITASNSSGKLLLTADTATAGSTAAVTMTNLTVAGGGALDFTDADFGFSAGGAGASAGGTAGIANVSMKSVDTLVSEINANASLTDKVRASNDNGKLRIENLSTSDLTVTGISSTTGRLDGTSGTGTIGGNDVRKNLVKQFNELRDQLNKTADDASFNGVNLLRGDKLKLTFNETGTSTMEIQAKTSAGVATSINATNLNISSAVDADFDSDTTLDSRLDTLQNSLNSLRSQASTFGSNLSIVQNRQDFTKSMIATLQTGADKLVLADTNEEAANMLALQTRQQLSSTALSLASQADQAALRLF